MSIFQISFREEGHTKAIIISWSFNNFNNSKGYICYSSERNLQVITKPLTRISWLMRPLARNEQDESFRTGEHQVIILTHPSSRVAFFSAGYPDIVSEIRDCKGISKLPLIQLISPYKINWIIVSLEIPLQSLMYTLNWTEEDQRWSMIGNFLAYTSSRHLSLPGMKKMCQAE